jgi:hypothetical protein
MYTNIKSKISWNQIVDKSSEFYNSMQNKSFKFSSAFSLYITYVNLINRENALLYDNKENYSEYKLAVVSGIKGAIYGKTFPLSLISMFNNSENHYVPTGSFGIKKDSKIEKIGDIKEKLRVNSNLKK